MDKRTLINGLGLGFQSSYRDISTTKLPKNPNLVWTSQFSNNTLAIRYIF